MPSPEKQPPGKKPATDKLKDKIHKHLNDKNDHISDEDIRDVVVGSSSDQSPADDGRTITEKASELEKEIPKDKPATPWDTTGG